MPNRNILPSCGQKHRWLVEYSSEGGIYDWFMEFMVVVDGQPQKLDSKQFSFIPTVRARTTSI